jgi:hypothetical protein
MPELCGRCGHSLDHIRKPCNHQSNEGKPCECPWGIRTDVFIALQLSDLLKLTQAQLSAQRETNELLKQGLGLGAEKNGGLILVP